MVRGARDPHFETQEMPRYTGHIYLRIATVETNVTEKRSGREGHCVTGAQQTHVKEAMRTPFVDHCMLQNAARQHLTSSEKAIAAWLTHSA